MLASTTLQSITTIEKNLTRGKKVWEAYEETYFECVKSEFQLLDSVMKLCKDGRIKDCFVLLRSGFEMSLYFRLMTDGEIYQFDRIWNIVPLPSNSNPTARDQTYQMWMKNWKSGSELYRDVLRITKVGNESIMTTYQLRGLYDSKDVEKKGTVIPWYLAVVGEYDADIRFLSTLPSISAGDPFPEITSKRKIVQDLYHKRYFTFESIVRNLLLNELVTEQQAEIIRIHYNYLSSFVHPSNRSIKPMLGDSYFAKTAPLFSPWLVLLYICRISLTLLRSIILRFKRTNAQAETEVHDKIIKRLENATLYFWYIDNDPTEADLRFSNSQKLARPELNSNNTTVIYNSDPLERLQWLGNELLPH